MNNNNIVISAAIFRDNVVANNTKVGVAIAHLAYYISGALKPYFNIRQF